MLNDNIVLVVPSSLSISPYIYNYLEIFENHKIDVDLVIWDRLVSFQNKDIEEYSHAIKNVFIYTDGLNEIRRSISDYVKYSVFIRRHLQIKKYDKIIIFSPQLYFFLFPFISRKQKVLLDVRDYHKIIGYLSKLNLFSKIDQIVVSSPAFTNFFPTHSKVIVNHNTNINKEIIENLINKKNADKISKFHKDEIISVGSIGAFRDWKINLSLIEQLDQESKIHLLYAGEGLYTEKLEKYKYDNNLDFITISGHFRRDELDKLYSAIDITNVIRDNTVLINKYALPNRLYDSLINKKPLLSNEGNYLSEIIQEYNLGLVISEISNVEKELEKYFSEFDSRLFNQRAINYLQKVCNENEEFTRELINFIKNKEDFECKR